MNEKWKESKGIKFWINYGVFYYAPPLVKGIHYFHYCEKCGMKVISIEEKLCYVCMLKSKKFYKKILNFSESEKKCWGYHTSINDVKEGWSFIEGMMWALLFGAVLDCNSLNKTPKCPDLIDKTDAEKLKILGYSDSEIKVFLNYKENYYD